MIGETVQDDVIVCALSGPVLAMLVYLVRAALSQGPLSCAQALLRQLRGAVRLWRSPAADDEVGHIVQEKLERQKLNHFRILCQTLNWVMLLYTINKVLLIAVGWQKMVSNFAMDIIHVLVQSMLSLIVLRPSLVSQRTMDAIFVFLSLSLAIYITPWVCHPDAFFGSLTLVNFVTILLTLVRRSTLMCAGLNAMVAASACSLIWTHGGDQLIRPHGLMSTQLIATGFISVFVEVLDKSMGHMVRKGLEVEAAKEVLSAVSALLKSCCDMVVELDSEGAIVGPARELSSYLLRGPGHSLQGTKFVELMSSDDDRLFVSGKLCEPWSSSSCRIADARQIRMKDSDAKVLQLELLWFQFRHLDQRLRHMVGLREHEGYAGTLDLAVRGRGAQIKDTHQSPPPQPVRAEEVEGGSIPEGFSVVISGSVEDPPALVVVDSTHWDYPVRSCSPSFCKRIGRMDPGDSFADAIKSDDLFVRWLQTEILKLKSAVGEAQRDHHIVLQMPQGDMHATCRLMCKANVDESEGLEGGASTLDAKSVTLGLFNIERHHNSSPASDAFHLRGTPVTRFSL